MVQVNRLSLNMDRTVVLHCRVPKAPIGDCRELFQSLFDPTDFKYGIPLPDGTTISLKENPEEEEDADNHYGEEFKTAVKTVVDEAKDEVVEEVTKSFWAQHQGLLIAILVFVLLLALLILYCVCKGPQYLQNKLDNLKKDSAAKTTEIVYNTMKKLQTQPDEEVEEDEDK